DAVLEELLAASGGDALERITVSIRWPGAARGDVRAEHDRPPEHRRTVQGELHDVPRSDQRQVLPGVEVPVLRGAWRDHGGRVEATQCDLPVSGAGAVLEGRDYALVEWVADGDGPA